MGERKGQGLYNRIFRRVSTNNHMATDSEVVQYLYNIDNHIFDEIMYNVHKDNPELQKSERVTE
jgi:hypothetical protein